MTGGARGIGRAIATTFLEAGDRVAVLDRELTVDIPRVGSPIDDSGAADGGRLIGFELDLTDEMEVNSAVADVLASWGKIDVLVCNAGGGSGTPLANRASELATDTILEALHRNLLTTVNVCRAVVPEMKRQRNGSIVTISSINGIRPTELGSYAHYGIAKAAVIQYTRYLARDVGEYGITVNSVAPGPVATERLERLYEAEGLKLNGKEAANGQVAAPRDIASATEFLAAAKHITGQVITIDGGIVIG